MKDPNFAAAVGLILAATDLDSNGPDGKPHRARILTVCDTPQYLLDHGFPDLPITITGATVDKAHFDHGITKGVLERLADILANPKALYKSATVCDAAVVVTLENKAGSPILVPIHKDRQQGRTKVNLVTSLYCKEVDIETRWTQNGLLVRTWSSGLRT